MNTSKKRTAVGAKPTSTVAGVYYRDEGRPQWRVRLRLGGTDVSKMFPVDLNETNKDSKTHLVKARKFAEAYVLQEQLAHGAGQPIAKTASQWTLEGLMRTVLNEIESGAISDLKSGSIKSSLRTWLGLATKGQNMAGYPEITAHKITDLEPEHFYSSDGKNNQALNHLHKDKNGNPAGGASLRKMIDAVRFVLMRAKNSYGIKIDKLPLPSLREIKVNKERGSFLSDDEFEAIVKYMDDGKTYKATIDAIRFCRWTAVRRSEAVKLDWPDINFKKRIALLRGTKAKRGEYRQREIPLNLDMTELLKRLYEETKDKKGPVFAYRHNNAWKRLRADTVTQAWARARKWVEDNRDDLDIKGKRLHDLRVTRTVELGSNPNLTYAEAAKITGHNDLAMFMHYFQPKPELLVHKLDAFNRAESENRQATGQGTVENAIDALLALENHGDMAVAFGKAMERFVNRTSNGVGVVLPTDKALPE